MGLIIGGHVELELGSNIGWVPLAFKAGFGLLHG